MIALKAHMSVFRDCILRTVFNIRTPKPNQVRLSASNALQLDNEGS